MTIIYTSATLSATHRTYKGIPLREKDSKYTRSNDVHGAYFELFYLRRIPIYVLWYQNQSIIKSKTRKWKK